MAVSYFLKSLVCGECYVRWRRKRICLIHTNVILIIHNIKLYFIVIKHRRDITIPVTNELGLSSSQMRLYISKECHTISRIFAILSSRGHSSKSTETVFMTNVISFRKALQKTPRVKTWCHIPPIVLLSALTLIDSC